MNATDILWEETIPGGSAWSHVLKRGTALRIVDLEGGANAGALFFNAEFPAERYNMPDTLKAQHTGRLTANHALYSDMGRVLVSITGDTCGWHDTICGYADERAVLAQFGPATYQQHRNKFHRNAYDNFLMELQKYGLSERDLPANVNFFSKVSVDANGAMHFHDANSKPGATVELRAEMNVLTVIDTCQHPLDPASAYNPKPVHIEIRRAAPVADHDPCRTACPENQRGFINTDRYFL